MVGRPESLHLDCWGEVEQADGYDVVLTDETSSTDLEKLFFVNLGGYDPKEFSELHRNILLVAPDAKAATRKALAQTRSWSLPHKDNIFEVEKAVDVTEMMTRYGFSLKLTKATTEKPFQFKCDYVPIVSSPDSYLPRSPPNSLSYRATVELVLVQRIDHNRSKAAQRGG